MNDSQRAEFYRRRARNLSRQAAWANLTGDTRKATNLEKLAYISTIKANYHQRRADLGRSV